MGSHSPVTQGLPVLMGMWGSHGGGVSSLHCFLPDLLLHRGSRTQDIDSQEFIISQASGNRRKHPCKEMRRI